MGTIVYCANGKYGEIKFGDLSQRSPTQNRIARSQAEVFITEVAI